MSRKMFAVAALALLAPVMASKAQVSFGVAAGAAVPTGKTADSYDTGYNLTAMLGISAPLAPVGFRVDGMFNEFNAKNVTPTVKFRSSAITANAIVKAPISAIVLSPYLIGGIGMYNTNLSPKPALFESSNDFGWNLGAGVKFGLAGFSALGEVRYHQYTANNATVRYVPITFGIMF
jgi:opacity protein-like surface antigen